MAKLAPTAERLALVAGAVLHRRELHDAEREVGRLTALLDRHEGAPGVPAAHRQHQRPGLLVEVVVRLAELQRHEVARVGAVVRQLLDPCEHVDDARVLERELAVQQLAVVVGAELAQERLGQDVGAGIGPVAHALGDRRDVRGVRLLDEVDELVLRELRVRAAG